VLHTPVSERGQDESARWGSPLSRPGGERGSRLFAARGRDNQPSADSSATRGLRSQQKIAINRAQSTYGNQAILRALNHSINSSPQILQRKCACDGSGGDCSACAEKEESTLQRHAANHSEPNGVPAIVHEVLRSAGQPLDADTRAFMEPRFGHDFSKVRVHDDARAVESARAVNALAYTVGLNIVFGVNENAPRTASGQRLLAHELAHVVQQSGPEETLPQRLTVSRSGNSHERAADAAADRVAEPFPALAQNLSFDHAEGVIQRQEAGSGNDGQQPAPQQPPQGSSGCEGWQRDPQSFSKVIADFYVRTQLNATPGMASGIQCAPAGLCIVKYENGTSVGVSLARLPNFVIARERAPNSVRCEYDFSCEPSGKVNLSVRSCA